MINYLIYFIKFQNYFLLFKQNLVRSKIILLIKFNKNCLLYYLHDVKYYYNSTDLHI